MHLPAEKLSSLTPPITSISFSVRFVILFFFLICFSSISLANELIIEPDMGRRPILSLMHKATSSIQLAMYGLTDQSMIDALIHAKTNGKDVQVLLEPNPYKNEHENTQAVRKLEAAHITIHSPDPRFRLFHQKTLIIDHHNALIMTFNFTRSTFKNQRNFALWINNPAEVKEIEDVFTADLQHHPFTTHQNNLIWSPDNSREKILHLIHQATSNIKIYAQDISDYHVIGALANAARQGIHIELLLSKDKKISSQKKIAFLKKAGVSIQHAKRYIIHAKVMIIDNQVAMLGSINLTKPSLDHNRELSILTQEPNVIHPLIAIFQHDWEAANNTTNHLKQTDHHKQWMFIKKLGREFLTQTLH